MSLVRVSVGSAAKCFQVHRFGASITPSMEKVHCSRLTRGVGPADSTGKSLTTYWPGGTRELDALSRRLPLKPREMNPIQPEYRARCGGLGAAASPLEVRWQRRQTVSPRQAAGKAIRTAR